jgi:hypothetical protein
MDLEVQARDPNRTLKNLQIISGLAQEEVNSERVAVKVEARVVEVMEKVRVKEVREVEGLSG